MISCNLSPNINLRFTLYICSLCCLYFIIIFFITHTQKNFKFLSYRSRLIGELFYICVFGAFQLLRKANKSIYCWKLIWLVLSWEIFSSSLFFKVFSDRFLVLLTIMYYSLIIELKEGSSMADFFKIINFYCHLYP